MKYGISEKYKEFEEYILYHELKEIKYRAKGLSVEQAHKLATKDTEEKYRGDPKFEKLSREINIATKETTIKLLGIDKNFTKKSKKTVPTTQ